MPSHPFSQVNVFSTNPLGGNPLAVIHDADDLSEDQMLALARWTNLSETTFLMRPTHPEADYSVRIFTPGGELPFAGHPTLGSCYAWISAGGVPINPDRFVQQCGVGLVSIRRDEGRLEFAAPPLIRSGPIDDIALAQIASALGLSVSDIVHHQWVDNGPGWCAVMLDSAEKVLSIKPNWVALSPFNLGVVGPYHAGCETAVEVRAFVGSEGCEDPVTGSLNASLAQWLIAAGVLRSPYIASQGTAMQRAGRVYMRQSAGDIWVGGDVVDVIKGEISI